MSSKECQIARTRFSVPADWQQVSGQVDLIGLRAPDSRRQITASVFSFTRKIQLPEFEEVCKHRLDAETRVIADCALFPPSPKIERAREGPFFFYSGIDKASWRNFSTYMCPVNDYVFTLYLESGGTPFKDHLKDFLEMIKTVKHEI